MKNSKVYFIHALSPLHPGVGQGVGSVDLPVAREKATGVPYLPGSSVKGVLRDAARTSWSKGKVEAVFGPETENASEHAGAAYFGDARLLLLPVRSYSGVFAYATSPYLLRRFRREALIAGLQGLPDEIEDGPSTVQDALVAPGSEIASEETKGEGKKKLVILEDLDFNASESEAVQRWQAWFAEHLPEAPITGRLLYVHDDAMTYLLETALEVVTRVRIDHETKTVARGALWFEENIPAESVLYGLLSVAPKSFGGDEMQAKDLLASIAELSQSAIQFGGNATVGRGLSRIAFVEGGA